MSEPTLLCAVAIPAKNEAALIGRCLHALAAQTVSPSRFEVLVLANNCTDATVEAASSSSYPGPLRVVDIRLSNDQAHAGGARAAAFEEAAPSAPLILSTDADCVPDRDWVEATLDAFAAGADAVAGRVSGDWEELKLSPPDVLEVGALEWEYLGLIGEARDRFDPQPHDPSPSHMQRCGANLSITRDMLQRIGGVPRIPVGEDRALFAFVERLDGRVRQDRRSHVTASARTAGRAAGGMAQAIASRTSPGYVCDEQLEPALAFVERLARRRAARAAWKSVEPFGAAWERQEADDPSLARHRLTPAQLPREIATLRRLLDGVGNAL